MHFRLVIENNIVTPANWFPGMPVILPYPKNYKELKIELTVVIRNIHVWTGTYVLYQIIIMMKKWARKLIILVAGKEHTKNIENECNYEHEHHDYLNKALDCKQEHKTDIKDDCNHEKNILKILTKFTTQTR